MVEQAPRHGASVDLVEVNDAFDLRQVDGQVVVDSLVASRLALRIRGRAHPPLTALVHQIPGGVSGPGAFRFMRRIADLALYRRCGLVIAAGTSLGREVTAAGIPEERIKIVPPGSDLPKGASEDTPMDLRRGKRLAVLNVANWVPNKGILQLLDAFEPIADDDAVLHLVGSPDMDRRYSDKIRSRLTQVGLREKVVVHGAVPKNRMGALYRGADVAVLASRDEGYGTVIAEALRYGVPVVAWRSGNIENLVRDGQDGLLFAPGEISGVTGAMTRLLSERDLLASMSTHATRRGAQLPTWTQSAELFFAALDEVSGH